MKKKQFQSANLRIQSCWSSSAAKRTLADLFSMRLETQKTHQTKIPLSSKIRNNHFLRFPFVATDILISCTKIAEKLIEQREEGEEEEVEE